MDQSTDNLIHLPENILKGWFMDTETWTMRPVADAIFKSKQHINNLDLSRNQTDTIFERFESFQTVNERIDFENKTFESDTLLKGTMSAGISINKLVDIGSGVAGHSGNKGTQKFKIIK